MTTNLKPRTIKVVDETSKIKRKKHRFVGKGEWYCTGCCVIYTSLEARSLNIDPECGCPNCGGVLNYEEA